MRQLRELRNLRDGNGQAAGGTLYEQVARRVEQMIEEQAIKPGDRLPGNVEMAEMIGVNASTISKAMGQLVDKGLIVRRRRAGTFVAPRRAATTGNIGFYYFRERQAITLAAVEAMHTVLGPDGYDVKLIPYDQDFFQQTDLSADVKRRGLCGAIFTTLSAPECLAALKKLEAERFPYVRLSTRHFSGELKAPLVVGNGGRVMDDAIRHLRALGHVRIGFVGSNPGDPQDVIYRRAMEQVPAYSDLWRLAVGSGPPIGRPLPYGRTLARGYLHQNPELTAVITYHPLEANALVEEAQVLRGDGPNRLSVVCLTDWSQYYVPMLASAWRLAPNQEGERAAQILLAQIAGEDVPDVTRIDYEWVDRGSTSPLPTTEPVAAAFAR